MKKTVREWISFVCEDLTIKEPKIEIGESIKMGTETLYISSERSTVDNLLKIAYELRHFWQSETNPELWFGDWRPPSELPKNKFLMQKAEVDANAYALLMLQRIGETATFDEFSASVYQAIVDREEELIELRKK